MKLKCLDCGAVFESNECIHVSAERLYGVAGEFAFSCGNTIDLCPYCQSDELEE